MEVCRILIYILLCEVSGENLVTVPWNDGICNVKT